MISIYFTLATTDLKQLESAMNRELKQIYNYCAPNKLSINTAKANYMLVLSSRCYPKINITGIEQKDYIKYLGVYIDKHLNWQPQIQHVNNKLAKNLGILSKLRYYIDLNILKQIHYALISLFESQFSCLGMC